MKLYIYSKDTKELIGETEAHLDPLESARAKREIYVIPPYCTPFPPLESKNKVNVFNEEKGIWELVEDNRGLEVFDKKGNSKVVDTLGPVPEGYSKTKKINLQEEKLALIDKVNAEYAKAQAEVITVGSITDNIDARMKLEQLKIFMGENELGTYTMFDGTPVILNIKEVEYLSKYFYVRSLLLPVKRNEILKEIKKVKSKTQLDKIKVDFNIKKDTETLADKTDEEISDFIREELK